MPDSLSDFGLQVFASKLVIKFTKIQATAPCSHSTSLLTFPKPLWFLHRKGSLLRAAMTRVGGSVQQRRVCKQHRHFRFALLLPFSAANPDPVFSVWAWPVPSEAKCIAVSHTVSCKAHFCSGISLQSSVPGANKIPLWKKLSTNAPLLFTVLWKSACSVYKWR